MDKNDCAIWQNLLKAAEIIEGWTEKQRKDYLFKLVKREFEKEKTFYRHVIKLLLVDSEKRRNFIRAVKNGK